MFCSTTDKYKKALKTTYSSIVEQNQKNRCNNRSKLHLMAHRRSRDVYDSLKAGYKTFARRYILNICVFIKTNQLFTAKVHFAKNVALT
jgi:hypothetical protein